MTVAAWKDTKIVKLMSTGVNPRGNNRERDYVTRRGKNRRTGAREINQVRCPLIAIVYNEKFRGVDLTDQLLSYYGCGRSSVRWHRCLFYREINKSLVNAYHNRAAVIGYGPSGSRYKRQLMFRAEVVRQLIGNFSSRHRATREIRGAIPRPAPVVRNVQRVTHEIGRNPVGSRGCVMCRRAGRVLGHGTRPNRPHETRFWCATCQVPVCHPQKRQECWLEHNV